MSDHLALSFLMIHVWRKVAVVAVDYHYTQMVHYSLTLQCLAYKVEVALMVGGLMAEVVLVLGKLAMIGCSAISAGRLPLMIARVREEEMEVDAVVVVAAVAMQYVRRICCSYLQQTLVSPALVFYLEEA